jgi:uncharacterized membrane protein
MYLLLHGDPSPGFTLFGYDLPRMHAVVNDFPPALLVAAVLFQILYLVGKRESFRATAYWTLMLGVVMTGLAILTGLGAEDHIEHGDAVHRVMEEHETLAYWTLGIFAAVALWRLLRESKMGRGERWGALALALVGTGVLVDTGVHGGKLVFDHGAGVSTEVMEAEIKDRAGGHHHGEGEVDEDHDHGGGQHGDSMASPAPAPATADSTGKKPTHTDPPGTPPHEHTH